MTIKDALEEGKRLLRAPSTSSFIDTSDLDAALLLSEVLHTTREELITKKDESVTEGERKKFLELLERRRSGECIAYIIGRREFRGIEFTVNPGVLVPRPDTETLVEAALEYIDSWQEKKPGSSAHGTAHDGLSLMDLCTGSGAVAISLKNERPVLHVTASDISPEALETATLNAARLLDGHLADDIQGSIRKDFTTTAQKAHEGKRKQYHYISFIQSDLFENIAGKFNIIVSNPPYIPTGIIDTLQPEVRREPRLALDGGGDGLDLIRKIISQAPEHLSPGGILLLEAAPEQMPIIRTLLEKEHFNNIKIHKDLSDCERVISAHFSF